MKKLQQYNSVLQLTKHSSNAAIRSGKYNSEGRWDWTEAPADRADSGMPE